jgi:uncharacterized protein (AIM24 family)
MASAPETQTQQQALAKQGAIKVIARAETDDALVEVVQYSVLKGSSDTRTAETLFFASHAGMRLKMVRIKLKNSMIRADPGALYFMQGDLEIKASTGGGILTGPARKMVSGETFFVNEIHGTGTIYLEPTFGHFILHRISDDAPGVICDKGMFYAGTSSLNIGTAVQKNISSVLMGGEGWFQTSIKGSGIAILFSPVPVSEVRKIDLNGDKLSVDGNFALMRTEGVEFKAEKSSKSWLATSVSGEGLLQTFSGTGSVWLAPTQGVYEKMITMSGLRELASAPGSMGTKTNTKKAIKSNTKKAIKSNTKKAK